MSKKKLKFIVWEDAFGCPEGWQRKDEVQYQTSIVHSVGFVIAETQTSLTIAPHITGKKQNSQQVAGCISLPKRQIISVSSCRVLE